MEWTATDSKPRPPLLRLFKSSPKNQFVHYPLECELGKESSVVGCWHQFWFVFLMQWNFQAEYDVDSLDHPYHFCRWLYIIFTVHQSDLQLLQFPPQLVLWSGGDNFFVTGLLKLQWCFLLFALFFDTHFGVLSRWGCDHALCFRS